MASTGSQGSPSAESRPTNPLEGDFQPVMDASLRMVLCRYREAGDLEWKTVGIPFHAILEWAGMIAERLTQDEKKVVKGVMELRAAEAKKKLLG